MLNFSNAKKGYLPKEDHLYALHTLNTPGIGRTVAKVLIVLITILLIIMFLPWQQNIRGKGKLTALNPASRPQQIESAIAGRITKWNIMEGDFVDKGDTILVLSEIKDKYFDPNLLMRLEEQMEAKENSLAFKRKKRAAYESQVKALSRAMQLKLEQTSNKLLQAKLKVDSDSLRLISERLNNENAQSVFERNRRRFEAGNITLTKQQQFEAKRLEGQAKLNSARNKLLETRAELINAEVDIYGTEAEYLEKISKAESSLNGTISEIHDTEGSLSKLKNEYASMVIRNEQYHILAPQSGFLVKALKVGIGETIKEGEGVAVIMPDASDMAVEMFVKAMDIPFISEGRSVRVQFDGWPALQFSGWQNVSVGTFGGIVEVIDAVNSNAGEFRILVKPDPNDDPWPKQLRFGSGIKGWVMLDNVPIWYEIWRQMNGFPPDVYDEIKLAQSKKKDKKK